MWIYPVSACENEELEDVKRGHMCFICEGAKLAPSKTFSHKNSLIHKCVATVRNDIKVHNLYDNIFLVRTEWKSKIYLIDPS